MQCSQQEAPRIRIRGFVTWRVPAVSMHLFSPCHHTLIERGETGDLHTRQKSCVWKALRAIFTLRKHRWLHALYIVACCSVLCAFFMSLFRAISASIFSVMLSHVPSVFFSSCIVLYHVIIGRLGWILFHMWIWTRCMTIPTGNQSNHTETLHNKRKHIYTTHVLIIPAAPFHLARPLFLVVDYCTCRFLSSPTTSAAMLCQVISCHILVDHMSYYVVTIFRI